MKPLRLIAASTAVACGGVAVLAPAPAFAAGHQLTERAVVVQVSGRHLRVADSALGLRNYTIAGTVPAALATGMAVSFRAQGATASHVRAAGAAKQVRYVARVAGMTGDTVTVHLGSGANATYRLYGRQAAATTQTLRTGAEALVSIASVRKGKLAVTIRRAAGTAKAKEKDVNGIVTSLSSHASTATVLTSSGIKLSLRLPAAAAHLSGLSACSSVEVYYRAQGRRSIATLVALANAAAAAGCGGLQGGSGFVTTVAGNDRWITVKTAAGTKLTLEATTGALRRLIDGVSVTDYVDFTYRSRHARLATLHDTSASKSGDVTAISRTKRSITVLLTGVGQVRLHAARARGLSSVKVGDKVDVDYYRTAAGPFVLVNCDDRGPARSGGNGGGPVHGGSGGSAGSGGSSGDSGSSGDAGSAGAAGAAG